MYIPGIPYLGSDCYKFSKQSKTHFIRQGGGSASAGRESVGSRYSDSFKSTHCLHSNSHHFIFSYQCLLFTSEIWCGYKLNLYWNSATCSVWFLAMLALWLQEMGEWVSSRVATEGDWKWKFQTIRLSFFFFFYLSNLVLLMYGYIIAYINYSLIIFQYFQ